MPPSHTLIFLGKTLRFVWQETKKPFHRIFHYLMYERGKTPPYFMHWYGFDLAYGKNDGLAYHLSCGYPFEEDVRCAALGNLSQRPVIFDIGANIGIFTLALARLAPNSTFHCFEPSPYASSMLIKTVNQNTLAKRINVNAVAVSEKQGNATFFIHSQNNALGDGLRDTGRAGVATSIQVPVTTIDAYIQKNNIKKIDLLKIDVEGAELLVLKGAKKTLTKFHPTVLFEASKKNLPAYGIIHAEIYDFFRSCRYTVFDLKKRGLSRDVFRDMMEKEENFMAIPVA